MRILLSLILILPAFSAERLNVILFVTDDQSPVAGCYGNSVIKTPHLDALAKEGTMFTQAFATTASCSASRSVILSGLHNHFNGQYGHTHHFHKFESFPAMRAFALPQLMAQAGYRTVQIGKLHVAPESVFHFDEYLKGNPRNAVQMAEVCKPVFEDQSEEPFFLYFATTLAHGPDRLGTKYKGNPLATPVGFLDKPLEVMPSRESVTERIAAAGLEREKADILWLDDGIGALLDKLKAINELENTVIFFIDDHGVESGKGSLYEGGIKTVSFVYGPNYIKSGLRSKQLVSNIDMVPTALELAGIDPKKEYDIDGVSMLPLLKGSTKEIHKSLFFEMGATRAVIKDGYKYLAFKAPASIKSKLEKNGKKATHICDKPGGRGSESPALKFYAKNYFDEDQLYQLEKDPFEQSNLYLDESKKAKIKELKTELKKYLKIVPGTFPID